MMTVWRLGIGKRWNGAQDGNWKWEDQSEALTSMWIEHPITWPLIVTPSYLRALYPHHSLVTTSSYNLPPGALLPSENMAWHSTFSSLIFHLMPSLCQSLNLFRNYKPLYTFSLSIWPFCLHFLSKENFMVHHLTPNLNSSILNSLPHAPFFCLTWKISTLPFLGMSFNYGMIPLAWNHTIKYVCATINLCLTTNCQSQQSMKKIHSSLQCLIRTRQSKH